jgi:hypothetical protein
MTFDQWMKRPVYVVQVATFNRAKKMIGIEGDSIATRSGSAAHTVLMGFRALPGQRNKEGQILRDMVATSIRMDRLKRRIAA